MLWLKIGNPESWVESNKPSVLKKFFDLGIWSQKNWIVLYMKVYLIESWYVQLYMVHISQNTQRIKKITGLVEMISFPNNLSQIIFCNDYTELWLKGLCKMEYVGKAETTFNLRLNKHRKETKKPNSILACKHFQEQGHNFNKHANFIIIDRLVNLYGSKEALRAMLVVRENFWILKLKTLVPFGLNQELNK